MWAKVGPLEESMMEKGSILPSHKMPVHAQSVDEEVKKIPIPSQMPKGIDFSELPMSALKSATVEGLISQNEDLMARLSVALRKIHEMEEVLSAGEREKKALHTRFQTMREQFLVLEAKDKTTTGQRLQQHQENLQLRQSGDKIEKLYIDLYAQAQAFQSRLVRLERYRARIRKAAGPLQEKAKRIKMLEEEILQFRRSLSAQKIAMAEEYEIKEQQFEERIKAAQSEHMQSINGFEAKLAEAGQKIQMLQGKADERDKMYADLLKIENERIFEQRQFEQSRAESDRVTGQLEMETASIRMQLKDLLVDREAKVQELTRLTAEIPNLRERNQNLVEQVESLQTLWNHKQRELEQLTEKNSSLQRLNQTLSVTLNQQRKDIHQLQVELDKEKFSAGEKIKTLVTEIQLLRAHMPGVDEGSGGGGSAKL
jgi:chromosome segregation ATPase